MIKIARAIYAFTDLENGDRFFFAGDAKKGIHEAQVEELVIKIRKDKEVHYNLPTLKQKQSKVVFLRNNND